LQLRKVEKCLWNLLEIIRSETKGNKGLQVAESIRQSTDFVAIEIEFGYLGQVSNGIRE